MIPLTDKNPTHRFPAVTIALIIVNAGVFLYEVSLGERIESFLQLFGAIPREIVSSLTLRDFIPGILVPMATSMFVHGGWIHLIGNMLYLWVFGDNVEDKLGRLRYLIFYLICGFAASGLHVLLDPHSSMPMVGASGAISGVLGAYLLMFPRARVVTLIPIFFFIQIAELPALVVLGLWFVMQFFNGVLSLGQETEGMGGVAWWAHVGGFVTGLALLYPFRRFR
jgi:membrane associated rhomboid family serine protease